MKKEQYIMAIDQGTTSTRAVIFDAQGNWVGMEEKALEQSYPQQGWVEQDPSSIYDHVMYCIDSVIKKLAINVQQIAGMGITNQRETTVIWDKHTQLPIYPAIVWLDKRTEGMCRKLKKQGWQAYISNSTGLVIDSYFSGTKMAWILDHVQGARDKAENGDLLAGTIDSWLIYKLTGGKKHLTDHSNASRTLLYNIRDLSWDKKILSLLSIPAKMLPEVQPSSSHFGYLTYQSHKIPIYGVGGDQQAALFGQGCVERAMAKSTYGTGCFILMNIGKKIKLSDNGLLTTLCCSVENETLQYALEGSIFIAGAAIQWLKDKLNLFESNDEIEAICQSIPLSDTVYVVPAFAGLGAPYWDSSVKAAIYGLTLDSDKKAIIKACVESMALQTVDVINAMQEDAGGKVKELRVDGKASENNYLMQFQSDMLDTLVIRPKMIEVTALGAALLAGIQAGFWSLDQIANINSVDTRFTAKMLVAERKRKYAGWQLAIKRTRTV